MGPVDVRSQPTRARRIDTITTHAQNTNMKTTETPLTQADADAVIARALTSKPLDPELARRVRAIGARNGGTPPKVRYPERRRCLDPGNP